MVAKMPPFPEQVESASVVTIPVTGVLRGLSHATRLAVQATDTVVLYGSVDGARWDPVAHLQMDDLAPLPFLEALRCEPDGAAVLLASFPLR